MILQAFLYRDEYNISGGGVHGEIILPDSSSKALLFVDDGKAPDVLANDGLYSAMFNYDENGLYKINVNFDNNTGTAMFVKSAFLPSLMPDGTAAPLSDPIPVEENYNITKTLLLSVSNVQDDDHGNTSLEATSLSSDNIATNGKIDYINDIDAFSLRTLSSGITTIRINGLAFGTKPHVIILSGDESTVLFEGNWPTPSCNDYISVILSPSLADTDVFIFISDQYSNEGGLYEISAGSQLLSDKSSCIQLPLIFK